MSDKVFNKASFEDEIYRSMEKQLVTSQKEESQGLKKLAKAADYLQAAASIFDQAGMTEEAEQIVDVLNELGGK